MPLPVNLSDVVNEMQVPSDESRAYINRKTGELLTVSDEEVRLAESDEFPDYVPAWQKEILPKVRAVLESDEFIALPSKFDIHEWSIMERFAASQPNHGYRKSLLDAIHGRGAFRLFKIQVDQLGLREAWFRFRDDAFEKIAIEFLEAHDIPYSRE